MSRTGGKAFQRKVLKALSEFFRSERVQALVQDIDRDTEELSIVIDPHSFKDFDETLEELKAEVERAFKFCSRIRGKKTEALALNEQAQSKIDEFLEDDVVDSADKRGRDEADGDDEHQSKKAKKAKVSALSPEDKAHLREIANKLSKNAEADPFLYPVDKSVFPVYYEVIDEPMDITTWKKKINDYTSVKEALDDLRLIWTNCCTFNAEGSEINHTALRIGVETEGHIESLFGKAEVDFHWRKMFKGLKLPKTPSKEAAPSMEPPKSDKGEKKKRKPVVEVDGVSMADVKDLVKTLFDDDRTILFRTPITEDVAPGYSDLIAEPMDLSTIKKKLRGQLYGDDVGSAIRELRLVWSNCQEYNAPGSDIYNLAKEMEEELEAKLKELKSRALQQAAAKKVEEVVETPGGSKAGKGGAKVAVKGQHPPSDEELKINRVPTSDYRALSANAVKDLLSIVKTFADIGPFQQPIKEEDAPGYFDVVKTPMDLGTVERKFMLGSYHSSPSDVVEDIRLIWRNCVSYNLHDSAIFKAAVAHAQLFEENLRLVIKRDQDKVYESKPPTFASSEKMQLEEEENDDMVDEEDDGDGDDDAIGDKAPDGSHVQNTPKRRRTYCSFRVRKYRHVLRLVSIHELAGPFLDLPVDNAEYLQKVEHPLSLTTIKQKITEYQEIPLGFFADLKKVFDNWLSVADPQSNTYQAARVLKNFSVDIFYQNFLSLAPLKTPEDEQCITEHRSADSNHPVFEEAIRKRSKEPGSSNEAHGDGKLLHAPAMSAVAAMTAMTPAVDLASRRELAPLFPGRSKTDHRDRVEELNAFLSGEKAAQSDLFRHSAHGKAVQLLKETKLPFIVAPSLYEITDFGTLQPPISSSRKALYPIRYEVLRIMRVAVVPENEAERGALKDYPHVSAIFKSKITVEPETDRLLFVVELDNGVVVGKGRSAKEAWTEVLSRELALVHSLGSKLLRCRAVFNRVCVSPDCVPFLEQVSLDMTDYYAVIQSPMWLREVHNRLSDGSYDNEFDFAWDMRLIFRNCKEFNVSNSALYKQADRLSNLFEQLFVAWVINVQDASTTDLAKGEWTDWTDLRYFGTKSGAENVCKISGTKAPVSELLRCQYCEDYYLPASVGLPASRAHAKSKWGCARCSHALELAGNNLAGDPFVVEVESSYPASEVYVPVAELGVGWLQARRKRGGLKNLFLSPLGYEIHSKDAIDAQKEFEATVDKDLLTARAKEFQETLPGKSGGAKGRGGGGRHRSPSKARKSFLQPDEASGDTSKGVDQPIDAKFLEQGRIINGKLVHFQVPAGYRLVFCVAANEDDVVAATEAGQDTTALLDTLRVCTVETLPEFGFFGFHLPAIRSRLEGLEGALDCKVYEFAANGNAKEDIIATMRRKVDEAKLVAEAEDALKRILRHERWQYEHAKLFPQKPTSLSADKPPLMQHFRKLFPVKQFDGLDVVVSLWDFLHACSAVGFVNFTLADIVSSTQPCGSSHNVMQTVFDEIGCIFTDLLVGELKHRRCYVPLTEQRWQEICMVNPINTLTWPKVLEKTLLLLSLPLSVDEADLLLSRTLGGECLVQLKFLALLYNHPLIDEFLAPQIASASALDEIRCAVVAQCANYATCYVGVADFTTAVIQVFVDARERDGTSDVAHAKIDVLENWLMRLMVRMGLLPQPEAEMASLDDRLADFDLTAEQRVDRSYGGFALSRVSPERAEVLLPHHLHVQEPQTTAAIKAKALKSLERILFVLSASDPEYWSSTDRVSAFHALVDAGLVTTEFHLELRKSGRLVEPFDTFPAAEIDVILSEAHTKALTSIPRYAVCHFTGITTAVVPEAAKWTVVPPEYLRTDVTVKAEPAAAAASSAAMDVDEAKPAAENTATSATKRRGRDSTGAHDTNVYALKEALSRIVHCRRFAEQDKQKYVERMQNVVLRSFHPEFDISFKTSAFARSQPLGYDAVGNAYWIFHAQSSMTLFPFDEKARALDPTDVNTVEPCILIQDPAATWYYCSAKYMAALLEYLTDPSPHEQLLKLRLIEKFYITNCSIRLSTLDIKPLQLSWLQRKLMVEAWATDQAGYQGPNEAHRSRIQEVLWARTAEVRMHMYYAYLFKLDDDVERVSERAERDAITRKQRRFKEESFDEVFDLNPRRGWNRLDYYTRLRQLSAVTTATTMHSDPNVPKTLAAFVYTKTPFLVRNTWADTLAAQGQSSANNDDGEGDENGDGESRPAASQAGSDVAASTDAAVAEAAKEATMDVDEAQDAAPAVVADVAEPTVAPATAPATTAMDVDEPPATAAPVAASTAPAVVESPVEKATSIADAAYAASHFQGGGAVGDGPANVPHVNVPSYDGTSILPPRATKAVEQLHILSGELLRLHASGKHAACFFNLSQSGISQCLTNVKTDCYGFRWRYYNGPAVDFQEIEAQQTPLDVLMAMQNDKHSIELYRRWVANGQDPTAIVVDPAQPAAHLQSRLSSHYGGVALMEAIRRSATRLATMSATRYVRSADTTAMPVKTALFAGINRGVVLAKPLSAAETANPSVAITVAAALQGDPNAAYYSFPPQHLCKVNLNALPHLVTSTKTAPAKLVKLKGELFNILYAFPEKALKWPVLDEASEAVIAKAGEDAIQSTVEHHRASANPPSEEEIARLADKNARKIKRRMRRKMAIENFALAVQSATTAQELLRQLLILEAAVPLTLTFKCKREALPVTASSIGEVAQRLYAFDRSIAYDAITNVESAPLCCPFRLRSQFVPRCHVHVYCIRYMGHTGKCSTFVNGFSRYPDQFQLAPPTDPFSNQKQTQYREFLYGGGSGGTVAPVPGAAVGSSQNAGHRPSYSGVPRPVAPVPTRVEVLPRLAQLVEKANPDIEKEQGYIPTTNEIVTSIWL